MSAKRVLISGGTGFVGSNLTRYLLAMGHEVHLLIRENYNPWRIKELEKDIEFHIITDMADSEKLIQVIPPIFPDWVFHLAAYGAYPSQQDWNQMLKTNTIGTVNFINACRINGFEAFIYTGSSSEYGFKDHLSSEKDKLDPNSNYAVTKASGTLFCNYLANQYQIPISIARLYSIYGPYEEPTRLIPVLLIHGFNHCLPPLVHPDISRDFVYVDDAVKALLALASSKAVKPGDVYNISSGSQTTIRELVAHSQELFGIQDEPRWGTFPDRQWDTRIWCGDNQKICDLVGWSPVLSIRDGLQKTKLWFEDQPDLIGFYKKQVIGD